MSQILNCSPDCKDWLLLIISLVVGILWSLILFFFLLKPKLSISITSNGWNPIKIKVCNKGRFNAVNLNIEACFFNREAKTSIHLMIDREDFLILPKNDIRIFKTDKLSNSVTKYTNYDEYFKYNVVENEKYTLRVRVYATHEYSGFGKAFEKTFKWNIQEQKFT